MHEPQRRDGVVTQAERNRVIDANVGLVWEVVHRFIRRLGSERISDEKDCLFQSGVIGLMRAIERFDPARGTKWSTYAARVIHGAVVDAARKELSSVYPVTRLSQVSMDDSELAAIAVDQSGNGSDLVDAADTVEHLCRGVNAKHTRYLAMRFGLKGYPEMTAKEIAEAEGCTRSWIDTNLAAARESIRKAAA